MTIADLDRFVTELKAALGPGGWLEGDDVAAYGADWRHEFAGEPVLVARPDSTRAVQAAVEICRRHQVAVVTQGGNTGLSGGSVPAGPRLSIVLSTSRLRSIVDVDPHGYTITSQAGVTIEALQAAAHGADRELGLDWGARGTATIGGAVSTDAGGINVLRYGTTRDRVLGLEVVLPDGRIWDGLRSLRKDASGYGLRHLFIGAEGTLGVVTAVVLRIEPRMPHVQTVFATIRDFDRVAELSSLAREVGQAGLTACELIPEYGLAGVVERIASVRRPISDEAPWYVLAEFRSTNPAADQPASFLTRAADQGLIGEAVMAETGSQREALWLLRDELPPETLFDVKGAKFDAAVPVNRIAPYVRAVEETAERLVPGAIVYGFGHLGDGNLHLYVLPSLTAGASLEPGIKNRVTEAVDQITWRFGGTISAEHGIGQELRARLVGQKPPVELDLMRTIKRSLDPDDLFNPGKLL